MVIKAQYIEKDAEKNQRSHNHRSHYQVFVHDDTFVLEWSPKENAVWMWQKNQQNQQNSLYSIDKLLNGHTSQDTRLLFSTRVEDVKHTASGFIFTFEPEFGAVVPKVALLGFHPNYLDNHGTFWKENSDYLSHSVRNWVFWINFYEWLELGTCCVLLFAFFGAFAYLASTAGRKEVKSHPEIMTPASTPMILNLTDLCGSEQYLQVSTEKPNPVATVVLCAQSEPAKQLNVKNEADSFNVIDISYRFSNKMKGTKVGLMVITYDPIYNRLPNGKQSHSLKYVYKMSNIEVQGSVLSYIMLPQSPEQQVTIHFIYP
jgi:hypothetical protein